jgi:hypothetical protein
LAAWNVMTSTASRAPPSSLAPVASQVRKAATVPSGTVVRKSSVRSARRTSTGNGGIGSSSAPVTMVPWSSSHACRPPGLG